MNVEAAGGWKSSETVLEEKAYAKINLSLDILSRREDGYHNLRMVMQSVTLCDTLEMSRADGILFSCDKAELPAGPGNTVYRAAELFCRETGVPGVKIHLKKRIPSQAGLGGGSADAAAALRGMNRLYGTDLPAHPDVRSQNARCGGLDNLWEQMCLSVFETACVWQKGQANF